MDRLTCMTVFRKVVERHSFSVAAEELSMSAGSVNIAVFLGARQERCLYDFALVSAAHG